MANLSISKFKENLEATTDTYYKKLGVKGVLQCINQGIKQSDTVSRSLGIPDLGVQIRGECCELLLKYTIIDYCSKHKLNWFVSKGLCITKGATKNTTEMDFVLGTPLSLIVFEVKYRKNKIKLLEECTMIDGHNSCDVFKQNMGHLRSVFPHLEPCRTGTNKKGLKPYQLVLFINDINRCQDNRNESDRIKMPVTDWHTIYTYLANLERLCKEYPPQWNVPKLYKTVVALDKNTRKNFESHMKGRDIIHVNK